MAVSGEVAREMAVLGVMEGARRELASQIVEIESNLQLRSEVEEAKGSSFQAELLRLQKVPC